MKTEDIGAGRRDALLLALAGFSIFALGDGITKSTAGLWPPLAVAAMRFSLGAAGLAVILILREGFRGFVVTRPLVQIGRGAAMTFSTACIFTALQLMPLATATAIGFTTPLLTAILSAILLRERISAAMWGIILLALAGVMLVLRPNFGALGALVLLPLGAALGMAVLMMLNRLAADGASPILSQFLVSAIAGAMLLILTSLLYLSGNPSFHVGEPSLSLLARIGVLAISATTGHWLIYLATIRAPATSIAPASYVQILFAVTIGWIAFGDMPDALTFAGIALIIGAGVWLLKGAGLRP